MTIPGCWLLIRGLPPEDEVVKPLDEILRHLKEKDRFPMLRWEFRKDGTLIGRENGELFGLPFYMSVAATVRPGPDTLVVLAARYGEPAAGFVFDSRLRFFLRLRTRKSCSSVFRWGDVPAEYRPWVSDVFPQAPDVFFWRLRLWTGAIEFEWRLQGQELIIIETPDPGFFIGRSGRVVRALQAHLGRRVRVERK